MPFVRERLGLTIEKREREPAAAKSKEEEEKCQNHLPELSLLYPAVSDSRATIVALLPTIL